MSRTPSGWMLIAPVALVIATALLLAAFFTPQNTRQGAEEGTQTVTNSIGIELVPIPGGSYTMGGDPAAGVKEELPPHTVRVAPFYLGKFEVTQSQFQALMGYNPSAFPHPQRPVEQLTWLEVQSFIDRLNRQEGTSAYRLPTEAEWEYAARAGTISRWSFGDDETQLHRYAWYAQKADTGTRPVGQGAPNPWGLYDMYGNVWEWVQDCWHETYDGAPPEGTVWVGGDCSLRMVRGGGWNSPASAVRSAVRGSTPPQMNDPANGFRIARSP